LSFSALLRISPRISAGHKSWCDTQWPQGQKRIKQANLGKKAQRKKGKNEEKIKRQHNQQLRVDGPQSPPPTASTPRPSSFHAFRPRLLFHGSQFPPN
jgi:hypothetical protein